MTNPTSSHPKIVVSEYNRTSTDSMRRTNSEDSRRTSVSSTTNQNDFHNLSSHSSVDFRPVCQQPRRAAACGVPLGLFNGEAPHETPKMA